MRANKNGMVTVDYYLCHELQTQGISSIAITQKNDIHNYENRGI